MKSKKQEHVPDKVPTVYYKKILYTTDLSESGRFAFHSAASLVTVYESKLTVFHVVDIEKELDRRLIGYMSPELWREIQVQQQHEAMETLVNRKRVNVAIHDCVNQYCNDIKVQMQAHADVTYDIEVKIGNPVKQIVQTANEDGYDLIVMGSHKKHSLRIWPIGSVLSGVQHNSGVPVLVAPVP